MEHQLKPGAPLRELLRQGRFDPLTTRFQLAWLLASNEGLFDEFHREGLPPSLARLRAAVDVSGLGLDDHRDD